MPNPDERELKQLILDLLELTQNQCALTKHAVSIGHHSLVKHEIGNSILALQLAQREYERICQSEEK